MVAGGPRDEAGARPGAVREGCVVDAVRLAPQGRADGRSPVAFSPCDTASPYLYLVTRVGIIVGDKNFGVNAILEGGMSAHRLL